MRTLVIFKRSSFVACFPCATDTELLSSKNSARTVHIHPIGCVSKNRGEFTNLYENPSIRGSFLRKQFISNWIKLVSSQSRPYGLTNSPFREVLTRAAFCRMACAFEGFRSQGRPWLKRSVSWKWSSWLIRLVR